MCARGKIPGRERARERKGGRLVMDGRIRCSTKGLGDT